jgi:Raf kinase inhibitor-like YbhB/YbcL family protein
MRKFNFAAVFAAALAALGACVPHEMPAAPKAGAFSLVSASFAPDSGIPSGFTCDGGNVSPALAWKNVPAGARSLALVLRDPDAPSGHFLHWAVMDMPPGLTGLEAGARLPAPSRELPNDAGTSGYFGPCPQSGTHHYVFTLYALDMAAVPPAVGTIEDALAPHTLAKAMLTGLYKRIK